MDITGGTNGAEDGEPEVIGEVDFSSALTTVHPKAIYLHQGQQYHVERLDFDQRKAYVKSVNVDYYTDAIRYTQVRMLEIAEEEAIAGPAAKAHGDVLVRSQVVGFKKIKFFTNENVGAGKLELAENEMHTTAFWITLDQKLLAGLPYALSDRQTGIFGLLYAMASMATLLLMCDSRDLGTAVGERPQAPESKPIGPNSTPQPPWLPLIHRKSKNSSSRIYTSTTRTPAALAQRAALPRPRYLLRRTRELIAGCGCESGCPSCVGPAGDKCEKTKEAALAILDRLCL